MRWEEGRRAPRERVFDERHPRGARTNDDGALAGGTRSAERAAKCSGRGVHRRVQALFALCQLGFDAQSGVGHGAKTLLGNQLFGDTTNTVGLIFDAHQGGLQTGDELAHPFGAVHEFFQ